MSTTKRPLPNTLDKPEKRVGMPVGKPAGDPQLETVEQPIHPSEETEKRQGS